MAKLEGVKVMDMVNGEITKIAYDGAEYAKVGDGFENANVGDIFTTPIEHVGMTPNAYYELIRTNSSEVRFYNDVDSYDGFSRTYGPAKVFRKISDGKPTIETRVDDLEKRVEALEKTEEPRKLKAGDFIKFKESRLGITAGKVYEVITYKDGDLVVKDDNGFHDNGINLGKEYEIVSADEAKWAKLGRSVNEYKVGDIIEITRDQWGEKVGSIVKVTSVTPVYGAVEYRSISGKSTYVADYDAIKLVAPVESTM